MKRGLKGSRASASMNESSSCRVFPDEEGTERDARLVVGISQRRVAEYSPMKRGLKGLRELGKSSASALVAEYSPMKRGLKEIQPSPDAAAPGSLQSIPR